MATHELRWDLKQAKYCKNNEEICDSQPIFRLSVQKLGYSLIEL